MNNRVLVCGAGGFIGGHLVKRLKQERFWARGVDLKRNEFSPSLADQFVVGDLRDPSVFCEVLENIDTLAKGSMPHTTATTASRSVWRGSTIFLGLRAPGAADARKHRL